MRAVTNDAARVPDEHLGWKVEGTPRCRPRFATMVALRPLPARALRVRQYCIFVSSIPIPCFVPVGCRIRVGGSE